MEQTIILVLKIIFWTIVISLTLLGGVFVWELDLKPAVKEKIKQRKLRKKEK